LKARDYQRHFEQNPWVVQFNFLTGLQQEVYGENIRRNMEAKDMKNPMDEEIKVIKRNNTGELISLPKGNVKKEVKRYKTRLCEKASVKELILGICSLI